MALAISKEFWDDVKWEEEHYADLQRQYKGNWVAIAGKRVIAYGKYLDKVEEEARRITGRKEVYTTYIEAGAAIYY
mgnify:CR=1 FL=1